MQSNSNESNSKSNISINSDAANNKNTMPQILAQAPMASFASYQNQPPHQSSLPQQQVMAAGNNTGSTTIQLGQSYSSPSPVDALQVATTNSNNKTNQNPIKYTSINVSKPDRSSSPKNTSNGPTAEVAQQLRFPWKLHLLLERCEYEKHESIVSWLPNGKSFKVHDKERFVKEIMPSFFGTQSFKTFQRNLNLWYVQRATVLSICTFCVFESCVRVKTLTCFLFFPFLPSFLPSLFELNYSITGDLHVFQKDHKRIYAVIHYF
jgi:hypothetical protein